MKAFTLDLRIDTLYMELLKTNIEFREVVENVLILSHGNARVEAGASMKTFCQKTCLKKLSLLIESSMMVLRRVAG